MLVKAASAAIWKAYESGRTPVVPAFSASSVSGCWSTAILTPDDGSSVFGAEISTPGIGPATSGLNGVELFDVEQAAAAVSGMIASRPIRVRFMADPGATDSRGCAAPVSYCSMYRQDVEATLGSER